VLLLPLAVAYEATEGLCTSASSSQQSDHDAGCPCAAGCGMQCCGGVVAAAPGAAGGLVVVRGSLIAPLVAVTSAPRTYLHSPQSARGPPAA
jgi:hypothetical protein